jgi:hypothetical protein
VATANANPGSTVHIPPGRYVLTGGMLSLTGSDTTIEGAGRDETTIAGGSGRTVLVNATGVEIVSVTIADGSVESSDPSGWQRWGGNVFFVPPGVGPGTLLLADVAIKGGHAQSGGGIAQWGGTLAIVDSVIAGNFAAAYGGGFYQERGEALLDGVAVYDNGSRGQHQQGLGGGGIAAEGDLDVVNSTVYANGAPFGIGGGILFAGSELLLLNSTVARNQRDTATDLHPGGGSDLYAGGTGSEMTMAAINTIIGIPGSAGVVGGTPTDPGGACYLQGVVLLDHHALASDASCGFSAANGSLVGVDAGESDPDICPEIDQRYAPRPQGAGCDIGAVESPFGTAPSGGGGGGGGASAVTPGAPPVTPPTPVEPVPVLPSAPLSTPPASAPVAPQVETLVRLRGGGTLVVRGTLPDTPVGAVTLKRTVRKDGRRRSGTSRVTPADGAIDATLLLPRGLRGARVVKVVGTYRTANGDGGRVTWRPKPIDG